MVNFSDVFPGEFLGYVTKYSERIQNILNEYEIVFFMARKAICFFEAMRYNGLLNIPSSCQVFSSRIVDYNVLDGFYGKRIAVIDDVVVKGESLHQILSVLNEHGLFADILVFARDINNNLQKSLLHFENYPFFSYIGLEQEDIYALNQCRSFYALAPLHRKRQ